VARRAARALRSRRASCRSPTRATARARSGSPRRGADWSASSPPRTAWRGATPAPAAPRSSSWWRARCATPRRSSTSCARPPRLRIGLSTRSPSGARVDPDCARAVLAAAADLVLHGHHVEEAEPATLLEYTDRALHGALLGAAEYRGCLEDLALRLGRPVTPDDVEPFLWVLAQLDEGTTTPEQLAASRDWNRAWVARTLCWFDEFDLLLTPTVCEPAVRLADLDPHRHEPLELLEKMVPHMAFTEPWNATGQPALSLPLAHSREGLPVGVQLVAAPGREDWLFGVAAELLRSVDAAHPNLHA